MEKTMCKGGCHSSCKGGSGHNCGHNCGNHGGCHHGNGGGTCKCHSKHEVDRGLGTGLTIKHKPKMDSYMGLSFDSAKAD